MQLELPRSNISNVGHECNLAREFNRETFEIERLPTSLSNLSNILVVFRLLDFEFVSFVYSSLGVWMLTDGVTPES